MARITKATRTWASRLSYRLAELLPGNVFDVSPLRDGIVLVRLYRTTDEALTFDMRGGEALVESSEFFLDFVAHVESASLHWMSMKENKIWIRRPTEKRIDQFVEIMRLVSAARRALRISTGDFGL